MGRSLKIFSLSLICCGILGLLAPAQAGAGDLSDPLVSQSWVEHRLDELLSPVEEELAGLEQRIRSISGNTAVDIQLRIGKTTASVNGETKTLDAAPRIVEAGYTLVPIRFVAEALGIQVEWLPESKQIRFFDQNTEMLLTVGSKTARINGREHSMDYPPIIDSQYSQGRTLVHIRFVGEAFGCSLDWEPKNGATETVFIKR